MISKIRKWLSNKRLIRSIDVSSVSVTPFVPVAQEDMRAINDVKAFNKSFDQQIQKQQLRAMVPHAAGCDVVSCNKTNCFKWEPDKIISTSTVTIAKRTRRKVRGDIK